MRVDHDKYNKNICFLLTLLLSIPLFTNFFGAIANKFMGTTIYSTYAIYGLILFFYLLKFRVSGRKFYYFLIFTSAVLGLLILNRIIFPRSYLYMRAYEESLYIIMVLYYPVAYAITSITDWSHFFKYMRYSAFWTPILCWFALKFFELDKMIGYMQLSNILLPGFLAGWYIARTEKKKLYYLASLFSLYLQIFYGSRMSFASALAFIVLLEIINLNKDSGTKGVIKVTVLTIAAILGYAYYQEIIEWFLNFLKSFGLTDSRTVQSIINGSAFESKSRDLIYERAQHELSNLGMKMHGLFGDRIAFEKYGGILYVHNIFYELLFSFGWIIGGVISVWLVIKIIKGYFFQKDDMKRLMVSYFVCLIFLRLLVSGSFVIEGQFLLLIGVLCNKTRIEVERTGISEEGVIT